MLLIVADTLKDVASLSAMGDLKQLQQPAHTKASTYKHRDCHRNEMVQLINRIWIHVYVYVCGYLYYPQTALRCFNVLLTRKGVTLKTCHISK